jgi:hypothetical protein
MTVGHTKLTTAVTGLVLMALATSTAWAEATTNGLTIYQIQSTTIDGDASYYNYATYGQPVDCAGGIVTFIRGGPRPRLLLQDPAYPDGWGGIQVKDMLNVGAFNGVQVGDWVELTNVEVEEYRGTTFLQWYPNNAPTLTVTSSGNPLPPPRLVSVAEIPAPIATSGGWFVPNHDAELYESTRLIVRDVTVTDMCLGKADDNYSLQTPGGQDCWASDYLNVDSQPQPECWDEEVHPFVAVGQHFCALTGVLEQYTNLSDDWDYYQLLTFDTPDLGICGDGDSDGDVDADDLPRFDECLAGPACAGGECNPPAWTSPPADLPLQHCLMMDPDYDGDVDLADFGGLQHVFGYSVDAK